MGARAVLTEMRNLLQAQAAAVVAGEHLQVYAGAQRHEELLKDLEGADLDLPPAELGALVSEIQAEKERLLSLLSAEGARVDYLLRLILGGGPPKPGGYPTGIGPVRGRLNKRT